MGWCHYQADGNCTHSDEDGKDCCEGIEKPHLFRLYKGAPVDEERDTRELLLDDLGIKNSGTPDDKILRAFLLETESKVVKRNKNIGLKNTKAEYERVTISVFKHEIKWCRCHMLPTDIIPGKREGSLTWKVGFRIYSRRFIENQQAPIRPPNKKLPASLTPLAGALLSETSDMQDRILNLCNKLRDITLELQQVQKESDSAAALANKKYDDLVKQHDLEKERMRLLHAQELATVEAEKRNYYEQCILWKATAGALREKELDVCATQHDMRSALATIENEYKLQQRPMPWDACLIEKICKASEVCLPFIK